MEFLRHYENSLPVTAGEHWGQPIIPRSLEHFQEKTCVSLKSYLNWTDQANDSLAPSSQITFTSTSPQLNFWKGDTKTSGGAGRAPDLWVKPLVHWGWFEKDTFATSVRRVNISEMDTSVLAAVFHSILENTFLQSKWTVLQEEHVDCYHTPVRLLTDRC